MARSDPFLQFQADLLGLPLRRSPQTESTALGAALLAGLGVGLWPDPAAAADLLQSGGQTFTPRRDDAWRAAALAPLAARRRDRPQPLPGGTPVTPRGGIARRPPRSLGLRPNTLPILRCPDFQQHKNNSDIRGFVRRDGLGSFRDAAGFVRARGDPSHPADLSAAPERPSSSRFSAT